MSHTVNEPIRDSHELTTNVVESDAVRVHVFWEEAWLQVIELSPPRAFFVGDGAGEGEAVDFTVPGLTERTALLTVDGGRVVVHAPAGAELSVRDEQVAEFGDVPAHDGSNPFTTNHFTTATNPFSDTTVVAPPPWASDGAIEVRLGALRFAFSVGEREARCPRSFDADEGVRPLAFFAASSLFVGTLAGLMAFFTPPLGLTDDEGADHDRVYLMSQYLDAAAEREREPDPSTGHDMGQAADAPAEAARGEAGRVGHTAPVAHSTRGSGSERGDITRPALSRAEAIQQARDFGMVGLLATGVAKANLAAWDDPGVGAAAAEGGLFGSDLEATGTGGLALTGIGEGGGGPSNQIGLASIGTCHGEECNGKGGFGLSGHHGGPDHATRGPRLRMAGTSVSSGSLPADVIQRVVRQNFGRFRGCYEDGLRTNPNLEGRVTARFVISRDGSVGAVQSGGSDLPDARVVSCVLRAYSSITFPSPKDGIVTVTYPLAFSPSA
ncbi:MAG TPA: AgmX/PglI C-terminal domain-containing protein [Polyangiaceae bacterium]|jgi:hypothetical protein|nr:AgmX/PglI C-terminal domain-containing protein [Polyangiaceae bacterium]